MSLQTALREHWPEYLIEAWALGCFMVSAGVFASLRVPAVLTGLSMGATAIALIHSPWGKRSGAHMNPAVTLTFLRLGKIWQHFWVYLLAPPLGMLAAAQLHLGVRRARLPGCAKLLHPNNYRCIHCGYRPDMRSIRT